MAIHDEHPIDAFVEMFGHALAAARTRDDVDEILAELQYSRSSIELVVAQANMRRAELPKGEPCRS